MGSVLATDGAGGVAVGVTVLATLVVVALVVSLALALRAARDLRRAAEELEARSRVLLDELGAALDDAAGELDRVDDLVGSAEAIAQTVGSASRLTYAALSNPVIKLVAFGSGTARAGRRLRHRSGPGEG